MSWQDLMWGIPLETRPTVLVMGFSHHGHLPVERYRLPGAWCVHFYRYTAELTVSDQVLPILPGYAGVLPPDVDLEYRFFGPSLHTFALFTLPAQSDGGIVVRAMQDLEARTEHVSADMEGAIHAWQTHPRRAEVRLWDILWELAHTAPGEAASAPKLHPAMQQALQIIEMRLGEPLGVAQIAHDVGLSHNHLTRLFRSSVGQTVIGYIQQRRLERARHLMAYSTLPIKAIAAQVGIPDLHQFNKTIRQAFGRPPREMRHQDPS